MIHPSLQLQEYHCNEPWVQRDVENAGKEDVGFIEPARVEGVIENLVRRTRCVRFHEKESRVGTCNEFLNVSWGVLVGQDDHVDVLGGVSTENTEMERRTFGTLVRPYMEHAALPNRQLCSPWRANVAEVVRAVFRMSRVSNGRLRGWRFRIRGVVGIEGGTGMACWISRTLWRVAGR